MTVDPRANDRGPSSRPGRVVGSRCASAEVGDHLVDDLRARPTSTRTERRCGRDRLAAHAASIWSSPVAAGSQRTRPWLVMVTGEPGSGKSTLGRQLAEALHVPYLSRDDVRWGLRASASLWTNDMHLVGSRCARSPIGAQLHRRTRARDRSRWDADELALDPALRGWSLPAAVLRSTRLGHAKRPLDQIHAPEDFVAAGVSERSPRLAPCRGPECHTARPGPTLCSAHQVTSRCSVRAGVGATNSIVLGPWITALCHVPRGNGIAVLDRRSPRIPPVEARSEYSRRDGDPGFLISHHRRRIGPR